MESCRDDIINLCGVGVDTYGYCIQNITSGLEINIVSNR